MNYPIRILIIDDVMNEGESTNIIMNYFRTIDRNKIVFDFLLSKDSDGKYEEELKALGGKIFKISPLKPRYFRDYRKEIRNFLIFHPEYKIVQSNLEEYSYIPLREAKDLGVPIRISQAFNTSRKFNISYILRYYFRYKLKAQVTHKFASNKEAGIWLYGKNEEFTIDDDITNIGSLKENAIKLKNFYLNLLTSSISC